MFSDEVCFVDLCKEAEEAFNVTTNMSLSEQAKLIEKFWT